MLLIIFKWPEFKNAGDEDMNLSLEQILLKV